MTSFFRFEVNGGSFWGLQSVSGKRGYEVCYVAKVEVVVDLDRSSGGMHTKHTSSGHS